MKKILVLLSGLLLTFAATSFAGNDSKPATTKATSCCSCPCGDNCKPGACPNHCGCCCDN